MRIHKVDLLHTYSRVVDAKFKTSDGRLRRSAAGLINAKNRGFCRDPSTRVSPRDVQTGFYLPENSLQERIIGPWVFWRYINEFKRFW